MRKLLIATTMLVSVTLSGMTPAHATNKTTVTLDAEINIGAPPNANGTCFVGSVHVVEGPTGSTIVVDLGEYVGVVGVCVFNDPDFQAWHGTTTVDRRSIRADGLQHAEVDATIPSDYHEGYHSVEDSTFVAVHVTWSATGKQVTQPDGSVRRDASTSGTISYCTTYGVCQPYSCPPPPPCPSGGMRLITAFSAPGYLQKSP